MMMCDMNVETVSYRSLQQFSDLFFLYSSLSFPSKFRVPINPLALVNSTCDCALKGDPTVTFSFLFPLPTGVTLNPIALRKAKIVYNFGLSECNRVKEFAPLGGNSFLH